MNKKELFDRLDTLFEDTSYEEVKKLLPRMKESLLDEYEKTRVEQRILCRFCQSHPYRHDWMHVIHVEERQVDYEDGSSCIIRERVRYLVCPVCKEETFDRVVEQIAVEWL